MTRAGITDAAARSATATAPVAPPPAPLDPTPDPERAASTAADLGASGSSRRNYTIHLLLALAVGFAVRLFFSAGNDIVSADETAYLTSGLNLWSGHGFTTLSGLAETHFPPGLPFLLGGVHEIVGGDPHTAMTIVTLVFTTLVVLPLAGITRLVAGRRGAVLAAWIAALCPALVALPLYSGGSAGPFTLFAATALWLALRSSSWSPNRGLLASAGSGVLVGLAFLTRPEGLFFAFVLVPVLAFPALGGWRGLRGADGRSWRRAASVVAAFLLPVVLLVAPYAVYLHRETGEWELTAKTEGVSLAAWRGIAADNRQVAHAIMYRPVGDGYQLPEQQSLVSLVRADPDAYLAIVSVNIGRLYRAMFNASLTPYPHWPLLPGLLFLLAIFAAWRRRRDRAVLAVIAVIVVPVATTVAFFVLPRYLIPSAAFACILVAIGLLELPRQWLRVVTTVAFVLIVSSTAAALHGSADGWFHPQYGYPEHRTAGEWIREHSEPADLVMSTNIVPGYYAHRSTVPIPWATPKRIVDFARHYGVRYLIVDDAHGVRFRPQLRKFSARRDLLSLRAVHRVNEDERRTVVYELVPRPRPFDGQVPLLDLGDSR